MRLCKRRRLIMAAGRFFAAGLIGKGKGTGTISPKLYKEALNKSRLDLSRPSFQTRPYHLHPFRRRPSFMDRMCCMRREGTLAWIRVVDGVGNRPSRMPAAARPGPRQAGAALPPASMQASARKGATPDTGVARGEISEISLAHCASNGYNHQMMQDDIWPSEQSAYITSAWGFTPKTWGCIGFGLEGRRDTYLKTTTDPFIMVIFVTETAPTDQPELRGKVAGFYEISHEAGCRKKFTHPRHHHLEPGKWRYALRATRAFCFPSESQIGIRDLIPEYPRMAQSIAVQGKALSSSQIARCRSLPFKQTPVYGQDHQ